jgi:hypothetical protein
MGTATFPMIERLSNERRQLQEMSGNQHLSDEQRKRLDEVNSLLPGMWDQYRRELAEENYGHVEPMVKKQKPQRRAIAPGELDNASPPTE